MSIDASQLPLDDENGISWQSASATASGNTTEAFFSSKAIVDRVFAAMMLTIAAPLIGVLVVLVRMTSRGPGIYSQTRVGKDGSIFTMYKLRSMRCDAEAKTGAVWAGVGYDPRMTRLGYWLRQLHLDELPQLVNVVRGDMSLVGPRPERPEFVEILADDVPGYLDRLLVKPGITGLAQINLPPDTDLNSVRRKLVLDREYIKTAGWQLDCKIIGCTLLRVLGIRGGRAVALLGLQRTVTLREDMLPDEPQQSQLQTAEACAATYGDERDVSTAADDYTTAPANASV